MDTRLGYIGGGISLLLAFFPENNWIKAAFAGVGIFAFLVAYIFHGRRSSKIGKSAKNQITVQQPLGLSSTNISTIKELRENDGPLMSEPFINHHKSAQAQDVTAKQKPFELSSVHISILKVFRSNDGELMSVPLIKQLTGFEIIVINSMLSDLEEHNLINATNLDDFNGGWQYQLTNLGRKTALKFT